MKEMLKNEKGIALILVLSSLMILATTAVQLTTDSRINYRMAAQEREQVQAYYLAKSAIALSKLIIVYQKEAEKMLSSAKGLEGVAPEPLYRMFPLSSGLLRGIASGGLDSMLGGDEGEEKTKEEGEKEGGDFELEGIEKAKGILETQAIEEFLQFDGDFESEITEENAKYNLNQIAGLETQSATYDQRKKMLYSLLMQPQFKDLFEEQETGAAELTHLIHDWVDSNEQVNEFDQVQRGDEDSKYSKVEYHVKDGKFASVSELRLIPGMTDAIYKALEPMVTVYTGTEKINICLASEELAMAFVHHFSNHAGCASPVTYEDEEKIKGIASEMVGGCPETDQISQALNEKLGVGDIEGGAASGCSFQVKDLLSSDNVVFRIKGTGTVGDTSLSLVEVVNTKSKEPNKWETYYYRIE